MSRPARGARPGGVSASTLARGVFVVLVLASFLAIFYAQELKRESALIQSQTRTLVRFRPVGGPVTQAHFHVLATVAEPVDVSIVSERTGRVVRVLHTRVRFYHRVAITWDGWTSRGALAPAGFYSARMHFHVEDRTVALKVRLQLEGPAG